jgi:hypothetical protein
MPVLLEGFRENTSLHEVNIVGYEHGKWSQELSFLLYRNKVVRLLQDSDTEDRESFGLWSRALGSVATRPDVLFHVLTSKAGLIRAAPGENSKKRKRDDSLSSNIFRRISSGATRTCLVARFRPPVQSRSQASPCITSLRSDGLKPESITVPSVPF